MVPQWIKDIYMNALKYGKKPDKLYVAIQWVEKLDGGFWYIRIKPVLMGREMGKNLKYSPFVRDMQDKNVMVLRLDDFIDIMKERESDELQVSPDRFRKRDISVGI